MHMSQSLLLHSGVAVRPCEWGYGVFADELILAGSIIEECHYLKMLDKHCRQPPLDDYVFQIKWDESEARPEGDWSAIILGYGMIYNHSREPNAAYYRSQERNLYTYYALRDIQPGEQILINYGENWWATRGQSSP
jgi:hypothetical protein